jgi:hypothetical protein
VLVPWNVDRPRAEEVFGRRAGHQAKENATAADRSKSEKKRWWQWLLAYPTIITSATGAVAHRPGKHHRGPHDFPFVRGLAQARVQSRVVIPP